jgi:hypothetical protein
MTVRMVVSVMLFLDEGSEVGAGNRRKMRGKEEGRPPKRKSQVED